MWPDSSHRPRFSRHLLLRNWRHVLRLRNLGHIAVSIRLLLRREELAVVSRYLLRNWGRRAIYLFYAGLREDGCQSPCVIWDILCVCSFYAVVDCSCQSPVSLLPVSCVIGDLDSFHLYSLRREYEVAEVTRIAEDGGRMVYSLVFLLEMLKR